MNITFYNALTISSKEFYIIRKILAGSNHFLLEMAKILHLVNLINVAANVNIAKQISIPKRFYVIVSTYLKPSIHLQVIVFSKVFMQKLIKKVFHKKLPLGNSSLAACFV